MKLSNYEKKLILELLENERFALCQHSLKELALKASGWGQKEAKYINGIIEKLELRKRDPNEMP